MNKEKNKIKLYLKKIWDFATHHNGVIIALELAIFAGVIFTLASENEVDGNLQSSTAQLIEINSNKFQPISTDFASASEQISVPVQENNAIAPEVFSLATPQDDQEIQQKYDQAVTIKAKYQLNGASLKRIVNDNPKDKIVVEVGDKDKAEFVPEIKLSRWDEVNFKVIPNFEEAATGDKNLTFENDKIKFHTPKVSFEMYETTDSYKYIWYLNEKPTSNKVEFQIVTLGLDFFYQPPLTQEFQNGYSEEFQTEITVSETQVRDLEGNVLVGRPENVVGSYAVYHSGNPINYLGGKEYKAGKAFHIFRPHLIDAAGKEAWGILDIDVASGIYSVEIPQDFLDKAAYPIKSNDEFGYHPGTPSGSFLALGTGGGDPYGPSISKHTLGSDGTANTISAYGRAGFTSADFKAAMYDDDGASGEPTTIKSYSAAVTANATPQWWEADITDVDLTAGDWYIGVLVAGSFRFYYDSDSWTSRALAAYQYNYTTPGNWTPALDSHLTYKFCVYATYTSEGGGAPTWQPRPGLISPSGGGFLIF
ncbi:MAG: hypothetical protein ABIG40_01450 [Parcubacteria group bacterium]